MNIQQNLLRNSRKSFLTKIGLQYVLHEGDIKREQEIVYLPYKATLLGGFFCQILIQSIGR